MAPTASSRAVSALLTDHYQLTMLEAYYDLGMEKTAVFELFVRRLPAQRNFMLFAGLQQIVEYLENLHFSAEDLAWLTQSGRFQPAFIERLAELRFTGDVHAMAEGTLFFPGEPVLRVTAPLPQAQLIESRIINIANFQTMIASKAARCRLVAPAETLIDFGMRRAHGEEAAIMAARASFIAGFDGTATVQAGKEFGIPLSGTMAHSFVQAHDSELQAFENFAHAQREDVVLLIDTYDPLQGAEKAVGLAQSLAQEGIAISAVRLDSGSIAEVSKAVRRILDQRECRQIGIIASGDLDEYRLAELLGQGCPIDGFGIGTRLTVSADAPSLDYVYKLQEYDGRARRKRSAGKTTWPGRKQVFRQLTAAGRFGGDRVTLASDRQEHAQALITPLMRNGKRLEANDSLDKIRERSNAQLASLPDRLRGLDAPAQPYAVEMSPMLKALADEVDRL